MSQRLTWRLGRRLGRRPSDAAPQTAWSTKLYRGLRRRFGWPCWCSVLPQGPRCVFMPNTWFKIGWLSVSYLLTSTRSLNPVTTHTDTPVHTNSPDGVLANTIKTCLVPCVAMPLLDKTTDNQLTVIHIWSAHKEDIKKKKCASYCIFKTKNEWFQQHAKRHILQLWQWRLSHVDSNDLSVCTADG